jgi:hypothetical protein
MIRCNVRFIACLDTEMNGSKVRLGLEVMRDQDFAPLRGLRIGLVTHPAA